MLWIAFLGVPLLGSGLCAKSIHAVAYRVLDAISRLGHGAAIAMLPEGRTKKNT